MVIRPEYHVLYDEACKRGLLSRLRFLIWFWHQIPVRERGAQVQQPRPVPQGAREARRRPRLADAPWYVRMAPRSQQLGWLRAQPGYQRSKGRWPWT